MVHDDDIHFMQIALDEALKGLGRTSPNPCVGAVIVKDGKEISRGYHHKAGTPHAEIHALNGAGDQARGATIYVTLEPCNHTGKTPPCSNAVAAAGISRVVVGMEDPNPLVNGSGNDYLRSQGIDVVSGVLERECAAINRPFVKMITTGLPWVVMKAGMSLDGRLSYQTDKSGWITGTESSDKVHRLRDRFDAIMVGRKTVLIDNPSLTTRLSDGTGRDPQRIVIDRTLSLPLESKVFNLDSTADTYVFCGEDVDSRQINRFVDRGVKVVQVPVNGQGLLILKDIITEIGKSGMNSVMVEGGGALHGSMLNEKLYDEAFLFQAPIFIGDHGTPLLKGIKPDERMQCAYLEHVAVETCGEDNLIHGDLCYPD